MYVLISYGIDLVGVASYSAVTQRIDDLAAAAPDFGKTHYLRLLDICSSGSNADRYLSALLYRDYSGALNALHQYFEYWIAHSGTTSIGSEIQAPISMITESVCLRHSCAGGGDPQRYQYCILHLAMLHVHFGHTDEALQVRACTAPARLILDRQ